MRTQNIRNESSRPVRACTMATPSMANKPPAATPARVEPVILRMTQAVRKIAMTETTAVEKRQKKGLCGSPIHMPNAIIHLPNGGWTT